MEDVRLLLDWMEGRLGIIDMTTFAVGNTVQDWQCNKAFVQHNSVFKSSCYCFCPKVAVMTTMFQHRVSIVKLSNSPLKLIFPPLLESLI